MAGRLDPQRVGRLKPWFIGWRCSDEMMGRLRTLQERLGLPTTTAVMERAVEALEAAQEPRP